MRPNQESCSVKQPRGTYSNVLEHVPFEYVRVPVELGRQGCEDRRRLPRILGSNRIWRGRVVTEERVRYADLVPYEVPDFPGVVEGPARWFAEVAAASVVCPGLTFDLAAAASCSPLVERSSAKAGPATRRSSWTSLADDVHRVGVRRDRHPVSAGPRDSPPRSAAAAARLMAEVTTSK